MLFTRHPLRDEADIPRILDLVRSMPLACPHVIDLPWRLSSLDFDEGLDAVFWVDDDGKIVGFAAWAVLDFFILPGCEEHIATDLFAWARSWFQERQWPYPYYRAEVLDHHRERRRLLEAHGFVRSEQEHYIFFQHALADLAPVPALPAGFTIRSIAGEQEAAAYAETHRVAFESTAMTPAWRVRTMHMPTYRAELNLVVTAPDGSFAGFCVGWFEPERRIAQIEPLGVHPRFHQNGLGRILLLEMLRRFKEQGAMSAIVQTDVERMPARRAYESVGFRPVRTVEYMASPALALWDYL
jgi:mycothiol synthase